MSALVTLLLLLLSGAMVAWTLNGALGLSFNAKDVPTERTRAAAPHSSVAAPNVRAVTGARGAAVRLAAEAVRDAFTERGRPAPSVAEGGGKARVPARELAIRIGALKGRGSAERYRIVREHGGLVLETASAAGAATGLYRMADRIRAEENVLADNGRTVTPQLGLRLTDTGGTGLDIRRSRFAPTTDYSLNSDVVGTALLRRAPWVDTSKVDDIAAQFRAFVRGALRNGYNGVVVPGFLEYVTFSGVGDGHTVYPAGDPHIARARAMVRAFAPVWRYAHDAGMRVYFQTDMLALSPPLRTYLERELGGLRTEDPRLWSVYAKGVEEVLHSMPFADGIMIRTGEGGSAYALPGWDYTSAIDVTTVRAVRAMLRGLLGAVDRAGGDRDVIFRTWSVGVGAVGDLHTDPDSYRQVLHGLDDPHLIVSTKYSQGDFYSHLALNPTLLEGSQRRIVEFQSRREFEGQGALPDDLGALEQTALKHFLASNPHIEGVWNWAQSGGPLYAGPRAVYQRVGFWQLWDVNVYLTGRLAQDPDTDLARAREAWIRKTFSDDADTVRAIERILTLSRPAITKGLYIGPYADTSAKALGLEPPPMMWIFEWDIATGDSAALSSIYAATRDRFPEALAEGRTALDIARRQQRLWATTEASTWHDPRLREQFGAALAYQTDLFTVLGAYRSTILWHQRWLDTGSAHAAERWHAAEAHYRTAAATHERHYGHQLTLPAYNFAAADLGLQRADRDPSMAWCARGLLALVLLAVVLALTRGSLPGAAGLRALLAGALRPWRARTAPQPTGRVDRIALWLVPGLVLALSRGIHTWFLAPVHVAVTLGTWLVFAAVLRLAAGRAWPALAACVGGVAILRSVLLLGVLSVRGPGYYWSAFWTSPHGRFAYVTVAWALFLWVVPAAYWALRSTLRRRPALGRALTACALPLAIVGAAAWAAGAETSLSTWNDQLALLPWGLHRILGITEYLGIPSSIPAVVTCLGVVLVSAGTLLGWAGRWHGPSGAPPPGPATGRVAPDESA
ncbi:hypothetical protein [Streptomyces sp. NPDC051684]|uniref:hypothetical protein n=1 Tax=Streptomyces sp. NPDC051684 TaxID=3365670 RepID=UPI0037B9F0A1